MDSKSTNIPMGGKPNFISNGDLKLIIFGGKGGVGKTTTTAVTSLYLSNVYPEKNILIASTDPAHSLSDSFEYPLGNSPRRIYEKANLSGIELDAEELLQDFRSRHNETLKKIISRGTYLDDEDISHFLKLSFPGLDEVMAMVKIMEILEEGNYDLIILDTAPTGHTMKLLALPDLMREWMRFLDTMMEKHRFMYQVFARKRYTGDEADEFIEEMLSNISKVKSYLQDENTCQFVPVTTLEPVVISETLVLVEVLSANKISVKDIVVNRVISSASCISCYSIMESQQRELGKLKRLFPTLLLTLLPYMPFEVKGGDSLRAFSDYMISETDFDKIKYLTQLKGPLNGRIPVNIEPPSAGIEFILFGGKGGVGKTTVSSSFALGLSSLYPQRKVLLFSTDPAHSLSDRLEQRIGDNVARVEGRDNLFALEIEPEKLFREFKEAYQEEINEIFEGITRRTSIDIKFDRQVMTNLMELAPPGLDEIMFLTEIIDYLKKGEYDLYILDNAPTGHNLRFLELPDLMQDWIRTFFEIILKYRSAVGLHRASQTLVDMSKDIKYIKAIFSDPLKCEFIPIAIPTLMALNETQRLLSRLKELKLPIRRIIINMIAHPQGKCNFCSTLENQHESVILEYKRKFPELEVVALPQTTIRGRDDLDKLFKFIVH